MGSRLVGLMAVSMGKTWVASRVGPMAVMTDFAMVVKWEAMLVPLAVVTLAAKRAVWKTDTKAAQ